MRAHIGRLAAVALAVSFTAGSAAAQLPGNPVYAPGGAGGLTLAADFGKGVNDASGKANFIGARAELGLPLIRVAAGAGIFDPKVTGADKDVAFAGSAALQVFGGPLIPVSVRLFAGAGYLKTGSVTTINVPVGLAIAVNVPTPGVSIDPWVAPRVQMSRTSDVTSDTDVRFGASAGVNFGLLIGLGAHVALDYLLVSAPSGSLLSSSDLSPITLGVGVHYTISIPSLGVPIVPVM
jgi:hypothetical protein